MSRSRLVTTVAMAVVVTGVVGALGALVFDPARAAVGPLPGEGLSLPADARFVVGFDVKRLTESPLYQKYGKAAARPDAFADLEAKTGINPERDLDQVFLAGRDGGSAAGVAMVIGRFDRSRLAQAIEARKGEVTWKSLGGTNVYLFGEGSKGAAALAFLDERTIVVGSQAAVEAAVANHAGGQNGLRSNTTLVRLLEQVKPGSAFWMVGDQSLLANLPKTVPAPGASAGPGGGTAGTSVTLPNLQSLLVTGELEGALSLSVTGETTDAAAAKNLADIVRGFAALLQLQAAQKPELQELSSALNVTSEGSRVLLSARLPYELLEKLHQGGRTGQGSTTSQD
jgi:hypothetical protein